MISRFDALLTIYTRLDIITTFLVLLSAWVVTTGHLLDWITKGRSRIAIPIYWTIIILGYAVGIVVIGTTYK
jgi:hypothetical protein